MIIKKCPSFIGVSVRIDMISMSECVRGLTAPETVNAVVCAAAVCVLLRIYYYANVHVAKANTLQRAGSNTETMFGVYGEPLNETDSDGESL